MKNFALHYLVVVACFLGTAIASVDGAQFAIRAVKVNEASIAPSDHVTIMPGDSVVVESYISGWADDLTDAMLLTYQVTIDGANSYWSGASGRIIPKGIDRPGDLAMCLTHADCPPDAPSCRTNSLGNPSELDICVRFCTSDVECTPDFPICSIWGYCAGTDHDPEQYAFIDTDRPDYVHFGFPELEAVRVVGIDYAWGSTTWSGEGPIDFGDELYLGTLVLEASSDACGTFTLLSAEGPGDSFILLQPTGGGSHEFFTVPSTSMVIEVYCPEVAACCRFQKPCADMTEDECASLGGEYQSGKRCGEEGQSCSRFPTMFVPLRPY